MRLCDIVDIKSAFMEKTDLSEEEIQTIIDDIPTAFDGSDEEYCEWKTNPVFPEQINNPHIPERENSSTTKYCPCCGKTIRIVR